MSHGNKVGEFRGWTLIGPLGDFVMCNGEPLFWRLKSDADGCKEGEMKSVRAVLKLEKKVQP